jgi:hypothetical protein
MHSMNPEPRLNLRRRAGGQTIIVAMIILGLLLILGLVFIGIINRNIQTSDRLEDRSTANDLSEAGIRYAHTQLLRSELGADWRGTPTLPVENGPFTTLDPDAFYLRPAGYLADGVTRLRFVPGANTPVDLGGPDGLGPYFRVQFDRGRALVRVRWAQSDANLFRGDPTGALRNPGLARNYIIIESVGREGKVNVNDPTTLTSRTARRFQGFASEADFQAELNAFREAEARFGNFLVNRAFASIGIIEHARFVSNKFRSSRPVEWGIDPDLGALLRGTETTAVGPPVASALQFRIGSELPLQTIASGTNNSVPAGSYWGGGSVWINGDLKLFGNTEINLNPALGDAVHVGGDISTDVNARLFLRRAIPNGTGGWVNETPVLEVGAAGFSSRSPGFNTFNGLLRDGSASLDSLNNPRGIGYKGVPSILTKDPQTNATRYQGMSRNSGVLLGAGNSGEFGYGRNVFVGNGSRRQMPLSATAGSVAGAESSLVTEWLTPGGNPSTTGWRGWVYTPPGAYMVLHSDGFTIQLDGTGPESTWKYPDGTLTSQNVNRFRLGRGTDRQLHVVNTFTFADMDRIDGPLTEADFDQGPTFGGVVYFEGNVRVRGVIPTDIQMSVVSNATIYVEGSITKGVTGNQYTATYGSGNIPVGNRLSRLSRSMLMLMAKDYVTVNTTQFFGPARNQAAEPREDTPMIGSFNPLIMRSNNPEGLHMQADFVLNPLSGNPANPTTWRPFPLDYMNPENASNRLTTNLLLSHTMDNGAGAAAFISLNLNPDADLPPPTPPKSQYFFPGTVTDPTVIPPFTNVASEYDDRAFLSLYGLGSENFERYSQFESIAFPLVNQASAPTLGRETITANAPFGTFELLNIGLNDFHFREGAIGGLNRNDYLLGRMAITPHDIRIEASMYAEEGSFFVIPGAWFNPNPNDNFVNWRSGGTTPDERNLRRYQEFGSYPSMPFYGEPLDVRIQIIGAVSENMPVPISVQSEWMRKWGWIPRTQGTTVDPTDTTRQRLLSIPQEHLRGATVPDFAPNLTITYDPVLASGRQNGFANSSDINDAQSPTIRADEYGRPLPPLPRLPVSPTLAYFGEVR